MLFVSPLVYCGEKIFVDPVKIDVLAKIQSVACKAERDKIVEERLRGDF